MTSRKEMQNAIEHIASAIRDSNQADLNLALFSATMNAWTSYCSRADRFFAPSDMEMITNFVATCDVDELSEVAKMADTNFSLADLLEIIAESCMAGLEDKVSRLPIQPTNMLECLTNTIRNAISVLPESNKSQ